MDEQKKYEVIKSLTNHPNPNKQKAAITLNCTIRHINRMIKGYKDKGKAFFIHGNRARKPANTIPEETRKLIVDLYYTKYYNANFKHFTELLLFPTLIDTPIFKLNNAKYRHFNHIVRIFNVMYSHSVMLKNSSLLI